MTKGLTNKLQFALLATIIFLVLTGCAALNKGPASSSEPARTSHENEPYFPTSFGDFEVPGELRLEAKKTLFIKTASFNGGTINFSGQVDVGSLTDFFVNSMQKNGWRISGEIRSSNVLLAFSKPNKSCMITIHDGEFGTRTQVYVYITEDVTSLN
jgi:hypothetical protein